MAMKRRQYPIRAVSKETGLSIDTLRAWERRYGAVVPGRTKRGRVYSEEDIERLELLRRVTEIGYSIGQVAKWDNQRLHDALSRQEENLSIENPPVLIEKMIDALKRYDAKDLDTALTRIAILYPPKQFVHHIVLPFMNAVGEYWNSGRITIAQEHLASASLRNLLGGLLRYYLRSDSERTLLLATPKGELHEFGILAAAILAISGGLNVLYLGRDLPAEEILNAVKQTAPKVVVLGWKAANGSEQSLKEIKQLSRKLPTKTELWVGGIDSEHFQQELKKTGAILIPDFKTFEQYLTRLGWRA
jgi:DNA-binding transcriptional MerR regulator/methylmalonyl-CoA mutase cobalamin-binding subunit